MTDHSKSAELILQAVLAVHAQRAAASSAKARGRSATTAQSSVNPKTLSHASDTCHPVQRSVARLRDAPNCGPRPFSIADRKFVAARLNRRDDSKSVCGPLRRRRLGRSAAYANAI